MPTTTNHALPYPTSADTADVPRDVKAIADKLDTYPMINPKVVTALPTGSPDGSLILFTSGANVWLMRRTGARWIVLGGSVLWVAQQSEVAVPGTSTWQPLAPGFQLTLPFLGVFSFELTITEKTYTVGTPPEVYATVDTGGAPAPENAHAFAAVLGQQVRTVTGIDNGTLARGVGFSTNADWRTLRRTLTVRMLQAAAT